MSNRKKVVFLYFELAGYFLACIDKLTELYDVDVHIVKYPVNSVAPFQFKLNPKVRFYENKDYEGQALINLLHEINPDLLYICGWSNKDYVAAGRSFKKKIPVVLTFDNPWRGTLKQYIATILGGLYLKRIFTHCWVPGEPNAVYARRLGFKGEKLLQGMYSADIDLFKAYFDRYKHKKADKFPRRFIYIGRYTPLKGIRELWEAFIRLQKEQPNEWELWCLGKGELDNEFPVHDKIRNFGFVQPSELSNYLEQTGVFILPTHYEHWGVVVHEFAAAGFPLICTNTTSAATAFLKNEYNGFTIPPYSSEAIFQALKKTVTMSDDELNTMALRSVELAEQITPTTWAHTLINILK